MTGRLTAPLLVVGLDMGDGGLIHYWSRQGRLPHLAALIHGGASLQLESTAEVLHTSTWPTFATGVLPGRHGVYYPYQPTPGQQFARLIGSDQYGTRTFWSRAAGEHRHCLVYDIPETFPERDFTGTAIYDWGTWARYGVTSAQPSGLLKELQARFGKYPLGFEAMRLGFEFPEGIEERLLSSVRYKSATAQWLLERGEWDLAVLGFSETHCGGHYLWPSGVTAINEGNEALFEQLFAVYALVDEALGALRTTVPSNAAVFVVSGDGVRANHCGWHLVPAVLDRLGYLSGGATSGQTESGGRGSLFGRLPQLLPISVKHRIAANLPWQIRNRLGLWAQTAAVDWSHTRAFALPTDLEGCVRINLKGREPHGIVQPGAEYEDVCQNIKRRFEELINPATNAHAVRRVWIRNETFPGPQQEELPDLIVTWNDEAPIRALMSPHAGAVAGVNPDGRPGTHSTSGLLIAQGPDIPRGYRGRGRLVDVAATARRVLGLPHDPDMDGEPWQVPRATQSTSQ